MTEHSPEIAEMKFAFENLKLLSSGRDADLFIDETTFPQPVTVKLLARDRLIPEKIASLENETDILLHLQFSLGANQASSIRKLEGKAFCEGRIGLVFNYIPGVTLREYFQNKPGLNAGAFLDIAIRINEILEKIHDSGIIHKDLNPQNIIISEDGKSLYLIDFEISAKRNQGNTAFGNLTLLQFQGTPDFIAPEQTGRMNRKVDERSDLYSIGATFYTLLVQRAPFLGATSAEILQQHLLSNPEPLRNINPSLDPQICAIVHKLLEKDADSRYQSCKSLLKDLKRCLDSFNAMGSIEPFEPGHSDSGTFYLPQKLYGIKDQVDLLLSRFEMTAKGHKNSIMVGGYSGVGKTTLVREIYKSITVNEGFLITGKFDQFNNEIPYRAVAEAFADFVDYLLAEPDDKFLAWKEVFLNCAKDRAPLLVSFIPALELMLGQQPPPHLDAREASSLFDSTFRLLLRSISKSKYPIVIFLDDLQWADTASLQLVQNIMLDPDLKYTLMIGAYRSNEVSSHHPLIMSLKKVQDEAPKTITTTEVENLSHEGVNDLVKDAFREDSAATNCLSQVIFQKTLGNALFVRQFLTAIVEQKLASYDEASKCWNFSLETISSHRNFDNVIELVISRLDTLSKSTVEVLKYAACLGSVFDALDVASLSQKDFKKIQRELDRALDMGIVDKSEKSLQGAEPAIIYRFEHDRIQQAVYALISKTDLPSVHLKIARMLATKESDATGQKLFELAYHYNKCLIMVNEPAERWAVCKINLSAGKKSMTGLAYQMAKDLFNNAIGLLPENSWTEYHDFTFELHISCAENERLLGISEQREDRAQEFLLRSAKLFDLCFMQSHTLEQKLRVYVNRIFTKASDHDYAKALLLCSEALSIGGIKIPDMNDFEAINRHLQNEEERLVRNLGGRKTASILDLPHSENNEDELLLVVMTASIDSTIIIAPHLIPVMAYGMVNLTLERGLAPSSAFGLINFALFLAIVTDYDRAHEFAEVALKIGEKFSRPSSMCNVLGVYSMIGYIRHPFLKIEKFAVEAYQMGLSGGNVLHAWIGYGHWIRLQRVAGIRLDKALESSTEYVSNLRKFKIDHFADYFSANNCAYQKYLMGQTNTDETFDTHEFSTTEWLNSLTTLPAFKMAVDCAMNTAFFIMEKFHNCREIIQEFNLQSAESFDYRVEYRMIVCLLNLLEVRSIHDQNDQQKIQLATSYYDFISKIALSAPENYRGLQVLLEGEFARIQGRLENAFENYNKAIDLCIEHQLSNWVGLSCETALRTAVEYDRMTEIQSYLGQTINAYHFWGATRKVEQLRIKYSKYLIDQESQKNVQAKENQRTGSTTLSTSQVQLELEAVLQAVKVLSSENTLERLIPRLTSILLELTGSHRGKLFLFDASNFLWSLVARVELNSALTEQVSESLSDTGDYPFSLLNFVTRTLRPVTIDDVSIPTRFLNDPYLKSTQPKSCLCVPFFLKGQPLGVIYLENLLSTYAFSPTRLRLVEAVLAVAAVWIENARLSGNLSQIIEEKTNRLQSVLRDVNLGIFSVREGGIIERNFTSQLTNLLGTDHVTGKRLYEVLFMNSDLSEDDKKTIRSVMDSLDSFSIGMNIHLLPKSIKLRTVTGQIRPLGLEWSLTEHCGQTQLLGVVWIQTSGTEDRTSSYHGSDTITREVGRTSKEKSSSFFRAFSSALGVLTNSRKESGDRLKEMSRTIHTLKGNSRALGFTLLSDCLHEGESLLNTSRFGDWLTQLRGLFDEYKEKHQIALESSGHEEFVVKSQERLQNRMDWLVGQGLIDEGLAKFFFDSCARESLRETFARMLMQLNPIANQLGKPNPSGVYKGTEIFLTETGLEILEDMLIHILRNAIDHGIEDPDSRLESGKSQAGTITLRVRKIWPGFLMEIFDDGRGLDIKKLKLSLTGKNEVEDTEMSDQNAAESIFQSGISTADKVSEISGRGVGMDAVKNFIETKGGSIELFFQSHEDSGSDFRKFGLRISLPESFWLDFRSAQYRNQTNRAV